MSIKISVFDANKEAYTDVELDGFVNTLKSLGLSVEEATEKAIVAAKTHIESLVHFGITEEDAKKIISQAVEKNYEQK